MLGGHGLVEIIEVLLSPIAAVGSPPSVSGMNPGVVAVEYAGEFRGSLVLVQEERRRSPIVQSFANTIPISVTALGKNKNYWPAVVRQVCVAISSFWADICPVGLVKGSEGFFRSLSVVILSFVVHQGDPKVHFTGYLLQKRETLVVKRTPFPVPIDHKARNATIDSILDLSSHYLSILARISNVHVFVIPEPWHPDCQCFRSTLRGVIVGRRWMKILAGTAIDDDHTDEQHGDHGL